MPILKSEVLADKYQKKIASGSLLPGDRLPPVRKLAELEGVSCMTVQKAYAHLKELGLAESQKGGSVRVRERAVLPFATDFLISAFDQGLTPTFEQVSRRGSIQSWSTAFPDPNWLDIGSLRTASEYVTEKGLWRLMMSPESGMTTLRTAVTEFLRPRFPMVNSDMVSISPGAVRTMLLLTGQFARPGSTVWVTLPHPPDHLAALIESGYRVIGIDVRNDELSLERQAQEEQPVVLVASVKNSLAGQTDLSAKGLRQLSELCERRGIRIVENLGGHLLDSTSHSSLFGFSSPHVAAGFIGFDELVLPSLDIGIVIARRQVRSSFDARMFTLTLGVSNIFQSLMESLMTSGALALQQRRMKNALKERTLAMRETLRRHVRSECTWHQNDGLSTWIEFNSSIDVSQLYQVAITQGFSFMGGSKLWVGKGPPAIRASVGLRGVSSIRGFGPSLAECLSLTARSA